MRRRRPRSQSTDAGRPWRSRIRSLSGSDAIRVLIPSGSTGRRLAIMALVDSIGTGLFLAVSAIFLVDIVKISAPQVGLGLSLGAAIALLTSLPIGALADRFGPRRLFTIVTLGRGACFAAYPLVHDFTGFLILICTLGVVDKSAGPLIQALVGRAVPEPDRVHTMAMLRSLRNIGFTLGALLGSVALAANTRPAYDAAMLANAASFVLVAVVALGIPLIDAHHVALRRTGSFMQVLRDRPYVTLAALNAVLTAHMTLLSVGMPIWIARHTDVPKAIVALLLALNTILAVAFQLRASRGATTATGAAACMRHAGYALMTCCLLLAIVPSLPPWAGVLLLVAAMVALTTGELLQSAGGWGLSFALARNERQAAYLALFGMSVTVQEVVAPIFIIAVVIAAGMAGWVALGALLALAGLAVPLVARWADAAHTAHGLAARETGA